MLEEVIALRSETLSRQLFDKKLTKQKNKFNNELDTKVKHMLPEENFPKIGNGL